jgi:hypothetical protein
MMLLIHVFKYCYVRECDSRWVNHSLKAGNEFFENVTEVQIFEKDMKKFNS